MDTAFKRISDVEKRKEFDDEVKQQRLWEERLGKEYENMFEHLLNSIYCEKCDTRHKKTLVEEKTMEKARYCDRCKVYHPAHDGDIWAEMRLLGINWKCYVCIQNKVYVFFVSHPFCGKSHDFFSKNFARLFMFYHAGSKHN